MQAKLFQDTVTHISNFNLIDTLLQIFYHNIYIDRWVCSGNIKTLLTDFTKNEYYFQNLLKIQYALILNQLRLSIDIVHEPSSIYFAMLIASDCIYYIYSFVSFWQQYCKLFSNCYKFNILFSCCPLNYWLEIFATVGSRIISKSQI